MPIYTDVAPLDQIRSGCGSRIAIAGGAIAVFAIGSRYRAISDMCLRCGDSLANGTIAGTTVRCRACNWQYDLQTGEVVGVPGLKTEVFETEADSGRLRVATPSGRTERVP